jgi:hypothetical protein
LALGWPAGGQRTQPARGQPAGAPARRRAGRQAALRRRARWEQGWGGLRPVHPCLLPCFASFPDPVGLSSPPRAHLRPYSLPKDVMGLPRLVGRATVRLTFEKADGARAASGCVRGPPVCQASAQHAA